ncbi:GNAT family N-acetyltransferase [Nitrosomonas sp.]|uniref:GNAT family N-acetyltransferase n=1 Tax=Nitrosomonas sp. TaxID=42353 RepID=UPI0025F0E7D4|nr:GNAT family N-acetyltransferase [Nitrosomonas sp.]MBY0484563.1 GNAT family N-acetyltransferase [Nitrosomonas sp.]
MEITKPITGITLSALLQAAVQCQQAGKLQEAEKHCLQVCTLFPNLPDAFHLLAIIYAQTGHYQAANDNFSKAIDIHPTRADFYSNYGNALWKQDRIEEAIYYCQQSLALDASRAETHNILGNILLSQNRLEEAVTSFRTALEIHPTYVHALNNLGNTLQKLNQAEDAVNCYRQALKLQANYPEAHNNLGQALKSLGRLDEAISHFRSAIKLRPDFHKAAQNYLEIDPAWIKPLDGEKLTLRRYSEADAEYLHQCYKNNTFMTQYNHYIPRHQRIEDLAIKLRETNAKHPCQLKSVDWIIIKKATGQPIGIANLVEIQFHHRRAEFLIGFANPENHNKSYGLEATLLVLDYAFNRVGLNKLITVVYSDNAFAQKNSLALGFVQESYLREQIMEPSGNKFLDLYGNGMTLNDFRNNKRILKLSRRLLGFDITRPQCLEDN